MSDNKISTEQMLLQLNNHGYQIERSGAMASGQHGDRVLVNVTMSHEQLGTRATACESTLEEALYELWHEYVLSPPHPEASTLEAASDAVFELRGRFNNGDADPSSPSTTLAAKLLETFGSWLSCCAEDKGRLSEDTLAGLINGVRHDLTGRYEKGSR